MNKQTIISGLLLFLLTFSVHGFSKNTNIQFESILVEHGLSNGTITCIFQDSKGFMWFGTNEGLNRFDGYDFKVYRNLLSDTTSISNSSIEHIMEDSDGDLWVSTGKGISKYDREYDMFIRYNYNKEKPGSLSHSYIRTIIEDKEGYLWIATFGGLNKFDKKNNTFTSYFHDQDNKESIASNLIWSLFEDSKGNIWVGTAGSGIDKFDKSTQSFKHYAENNYYNDYIRCITEDTDGTLWLGTDGGFKHFNPANNEKPFTHFTHDKNNPNSITQGHVRSIFLDEQGLIWIATQNGLNLFDKENKKFQHILHSKNDNYSLNSNEVWSIYQDKKGTLWFGHFMSGINYYNPEQQVFKNWKHVATNKRSLANSSVYAFVENNDGSIWVGMDHGGLMLFDRNNGALKHLQHIDGDETSLGSNSVLSLCKDSKNNLWVGTWAGGLNLYNPKNETFKTFLPSENNINTINDPHVWDIFEDSKERLWIATMSGGINIYDLNSGVFTQHLKIKGDSTTIPSSTVWTFLEDHQNNIWVGSSGGLSLFNEKTNNFKNYINDENDIESLSHNIVYSIFEDTRYNLWVGTEKGLNLLNRETGKFISLTHENGLPNNIIYGIMEDNNKNLWLSTNNGICKFSYEFVNGNLKTTFYNFDKSSGLISNQYNRGAHLKSKSNEMFFGGINGFVFFYPDSIKHNEYIPPVVITDFKIFNKSVSIDRDNKGKSPLKKHISETDAITLNHKQNVFGFEFSSLSFTSPQKNRYLYRLNNFDDNWIESSSKHRFATYTNIPAGEYTFMVKGSNNDGIWNEETAQIKLTILPPWWKTWWFYTLAIFTVSSTIFILVWFRINNIKKTNIKLEEQVRKRTAVIQEKSKLVMQQKEELETTLENLKSTQSQLIQSEKMASLGQLIAGIAHEINTPLGAINASIGSIIASIDEASLFFPKLYKTLSDEMLKLFFELISEGSKHHSVYSSREERAFRRKLKEQFESYEFEDANRLASKLVSIGIYENIDKYLPLFKHEKADLILNAASNMSEQKKNSENVRQAVERASKIVFALKSFSHQDSSGEKTLFNISNNVDTVITLYHNQLKHGIEVIKNYKDIPEIACYPDELSQVWTNIIHNSIQAMNHKGKLTIQTSTISEHQNNYVSVSVTDTGIGMTKETQERIFEPFFTTKPAGEGTGLGLDIVAKIINKHNGKIKIDSEVGLGTTFTVLLPIYTN